MSLIKQHTNTQNMDWVKRIEKMVREGTLVPVSVDENGKVSYARGNVTTVKNEWLIDGVPRLECTLSEQRKALEKWKHDSEPLDDE